MYDALWCAALLRMIMAGPPRASYLCRGRTMARMGASPLCGSARVRSDVRIEGLRSGPVRPINPSSWHRHTGCKCGRSWDVREHTCRSALQRHCSATHWRGILLNSEGAATTNTGVRLASCLTGLSWAVLFRGTEIGIETTT